MKQPHRPATHPWTWGNYRRGGVWSSLRISRPTGEVAARLTLIGVVIALHNTLELPRDVITLALGKPLTGLLIVVALGMALALLLVAIRPQLPGWRWLRNGWVQRVVLLATLAAAVIGAIQVGKTLAATFGPPSYTNDGTTLDQYAAQQLLLGHNPYVTTNMLDAARYYHQDGQYTTPLRLGHFANRAWTDYPTPQERRAVFQLRATGNPADAVEFESHVSYPAFAILPLVPFVWAGLPSVVLFFALCWLALVALIVSAAPKQLRPWMALLALADVPLLNATFVGDLDILYILLLLAAWLWRDRGWRSTVMFGLALAAKQLSWFYIPFYAILIWRERGWREAIYRLAGAGGIFLVINGPFIINNPHAWLSGVLAPEVDPMFPLGSGLVRLSLAGLLPLAPSVVYTALEVMVLIASIVWYWRLERPTAELGFALPTMALFFAWRSLTTYFYFAALPAMALALSRSGSSARSAVKRPGGAGTSLAGVENGTAHGPSGAPSSLVNAYVARSVDFFSTWRRTGHSPPRRTSRGQTSSQDTARTATGRRETS